MIINNQFLFSKFKQKKTLAVQAFITSNGPYNTIGEM